MHQISGFHVSILSTTTSQLGHTCCILRVAKSRIHENLQWQIEIASLLNCSHHTLTLSGRISQCLIRSLQILRKSYGSVVMYLDGKLRVLSYATIWRNGDSKVPEWVTGQEIPALWTFGPATFLSVDIIFSRYVAFCILQSSGYFCNCSDLSFPMELKNFNETGSIVSLFAHSLKVVFTVFLRSSHILFLCVSTSKVPGFLSVQHYFKVSLMDNCWAARLMTELVE